MGKRGKIGNFSRSKLQKLIESGAGGGGSSLTVEEVDGDPSVSDVTTIKVSNDTLADDGSGTVTITTGGGGGSGDVVAGSTFTTAGVIMACDGDDKTIDEPTTTLTTNSQALTVGGDLTINGSSGVVSGYVSEMSVISMQMLGG